MLMLRQHPYMRYRILFEEVFLSEMGNLRLLPLQLHLFFLYPTPTPTLKIRTYSDRILKTQKFVNKNVHFS